ncbi:hypothetical protein Ciccas_012746 [Cichlidogyrus casuarinus]|uniref:Brain-derived neurotrophic factor n=1 Tax=Cichlidogyrus casuarinus TaxID=1844966 RepID=A0ABD2PNX4_9PLAT
MGGDEDGMMPQMLGDTLSRDVSQDGLRNVVAVECSPDNTASTDSGIGPKQTEKPPCNSPYDNTGPVMNMPTLQLARYRSFSGREDKSKESSRLCSQV